MHKRSLPWSTSAVAAAALYFSACGGADPAQHDAAVGQDAGGQYDTLAGQDSGDLPHDSGPPTIALSIHFGDFATGAAVEGVECCLVGTTQCATTGATGSATLSGVPASSEVEIECSRSGYLPRTARFTTGTTAISIWESFFSEALAASWAQAAGYTPDASKALVFVQGSYVDMPQSGVTFTLTPTSGVGPVYFDGQGEPDTSLTNTDAQPYAFFANVEPGDYVFTASSGYGCSYLAPFGWATGDALRLRAVAGTLSNAFLTCQ